MIEGGFSFISCFLSGIDGGLERTNTSREPHSSSFILHLLLLLLLLMLLLLLLLLHRRTEERETPPLVLQVLLVPLRFPVVPQVPHVLLVPLVLGQRTQRF